MGVTQIFGVKPSTSEQLIVDVSDWTEVILSKESSGIVIVGTNQNLQPIGSGKGIELPVDEPFHTILAPASKLYILAENTNQKVSVIMQPAPWLQRVPDTIMDLRHYLRILVRHYGYDPDADESQAPHGDAGKGKNPAPDVSAGPSHAPKGLTAPIGLGSFDYDSLFHGRKKR